MPSIPIKVAVVYVFLMVAFRLVGKRELSTMSPFELVTVILIPEMASDALMGSGSVIEALIGISMLFLLVLVFAGLTHRFATVARVIEATPRVLVVHGQIQEDALNHERIHPDELYGELHKRGFEDLSQIRWAILENDGQIAFIPEDGGSNTKADYRARSRGVR
jgi:uncharacterized membrane protein YcaP (DUF421 family)